MDLQMESALPSTGDKGETLMDLQPTFEQKAFLVAGVALATVCACTNLAEAWVLGSLPVKKSVKTLLFKSHTLTGLVAACIPFFPIGVISERGGFFVGKNGYEHCYLGHSAVIIVTILTSICSATLLLLYHYLISPREKKIESVSLIGWKFIIVLMWLICIAIALLPYRGWNTWEKHDARCHLSTIWHPSFSVLLVFIMATSIMTTIFVWSTFRAAQLQTTERKIREEEPNDDRSDVEAVPVVPELSSFGHNGRIISISWMLTIAGSAPLVFHVLLASSCAASKTCMSSAHHYHEDASALPWASLVITLASTINPLLYIFSDDQVSSMIVKFLSRICCWWRHRRTNTTSRQGEIISSEVDSYVTSDTAHLVAAST